MGEVRCTGSTAVSGKSPAVPLLPEPFKGGGLVGSTNSVQLDHGQICNKLKTALASVGTTTGRPGSLGEAGKMEENTPASSKTDIAVQEEEVELRSNSHVWLLSL